MSSVAAVVVPVFGTVALGYGVTRTGLFTHDTGAGLTRFMYYLAIPALLFRGVAGGALPATVPWAFLATFYLPALVLFGLGIWLAQRMLGWSRREAGIAGMSACYANIALLGFPLITAAFGDAARLPLFILLATQSILLFPLTTYALEIYGHGRSGDPSFYARAAGRLALNPVIGSLLLGLAANFAGIGVPAPLSRMLELLSAAGPGCALVALGISLAHYPLGGSALAVGVLVLLKNVLSPALVWGLGHVCGVDQHWLAVAVVLAAMPVGLNTFIFSSQYDIRPQTVAQTIVASTLVSSVVSSALLSWLLV